MSKMYFHTEDGEACVFGPERFWLRRLCDKMFIATLDLKSDTESHPHPLRQVFPPNHYCGKAWAERVELAIRFDPFSSDPPFMIGDRRLNFGRAILNTALVIGSDPIKLAARLHAQCEIHAFVEGPNRAWLAGIIETGRRQNILHADVGWEKVVELLRHSAEGPVVTSFSGCDQFPGLEIIRAEGVWAPPDNGEEDEDDAWDTWYDLPEDEQWRLAMNALRFRNQTDNVELKPDNWEDFFFGEGLSGFDIMEHFNSLGSEDDGGNGTSD